MKEIEDIYRDKPLERVGIAQRSLPAQALPSAERVVKTAVWWLESAIINAVRAEGLFAKRYINLGTIQDSFMIIAVEDPHAAIAVIRPLIEELELPQPILGRYDVLEGVWRETVSRDGVRMNDVFSQSAVLCGLLAMGMTYEQAAGYAKEVVPE